MILPVEKLPVYKKDGFLFFKKGKEVSSDDGLIIDVSRIDSIATYLRTSGLYNIVVNSSYSPVNDLSFVKHVPFIKKISVVDSNHDISPINYLHQLQVLGVAGFKGIIDFNNFPDLRELGIDWSNKLKNLEKASGLNWLWLNNYKNESLERFESFSKLTYLYLYRPSIKSLRGISGMTSLVELNLDTAGKLEALDGFDNNNKNLRILDVYQARMLNDYDALKYLVGLEKLRFTKTGDLKNIDVLKFLPYLKKVILGTKVTDGDMSYLKNIAEYKFLNFSHYNLKST